MIDNFRIYDFVLDRVWARGRELSACAWKIELIQPIAGETPHARFMLPVFLKTCGAQIVFAAEMEDEIIGYRRSCAFPAAARRRYEK